VKISFLLLKGVVGLRFSFLSVWGMGNGFVMGLAASRRGHGEIHDVGNEMVT